MNLIKNKKAWKLLSEDEKVAISLKLGFTKSTWESGEIMRKAHYKFLEIQTRAEKFLKMFTEHLDLYSELLPEQIPLSRKFRKYLKLTIRKRMRVSEAVKKMNDLSWSITSLRENNIVKEMNYLIKSKKLVNRNFAGMILDFDRWNNFRILPKDIQEPSAFKRRNKNCDKKNIKNLLSINTYAIDMIIERYQVHSPRSKMVLYMPIFSKFIESEHSVIQVKNKPIVIKELSKIGFYLFPRKERAWEFYDLLYNYDFEEEKHCKEGQRFWPSYRTMIRNAINYNRILKNIPSRKFLESAFKDIDYRLLNTKNIDPLQKKKPKKTKKELV